MKWDLEIENLKNYVFVDKLSYEEIGRIYGCSGNNIKKVMQKRGIELPVRNKKLSGNPGIADITKQYLYQLAYQDFILKHGFKHIYNCFLMPSNNHEKEVEYIGEVKLEMITDKLN